MKGYLIKDYRLLLSQKNLLIIIPIGILFIFTNDTPVMGISYTLYVLTFLCTSLLSYDTFDNGMAFLMTQPGGRKSYVTEKYAFILINDAIAAILLAAIGSVLEYSRGKGLIAVQETFMGTLLLCSLALAFAFIILPLQLKFGPEKSRVVMLFVFGIAFLSSMGISFLAEKTNFNPDALMEALNKLPLTAIALSVLASVAIFAAISWFLSQKIMAKLEF